ncbi:hypothetical protein [Ensifer sp. YR511]|uniref:hypothetical protein n=1 Tax=Ensifer sp. YR511 TaxID=1855294 RepID=UPI00087F1A93|nr:hypothetical protein [Ensifer sp. YR511]SDN72917.1 NHL repeat-containing protein [Ensifer sp. YR511]
MTVGQGQFTYDLEPNWGTLPPGVTWNMVSGVAENSRGEIYVFQRSETPVLVFDPDGRYLRGWGAGIFTTPHSLNIGPDDCVYLSDDRDHTVRKFTPDGELLMVLGEVNQASDSGYHETRSPVVTRAAGPFNRPQGTALGPNGDIYVADGCGNARVHRFSREGDLLTSWGQPGAQPGEFAVPHAVRVLETLQGLGVAMTSGTMFFKAGLTAMWDLLVDMKERGMSPLYEYQEQTRSHPLGSFGGFDLAGFPEVAELEKKYLDAERLQKYENSIGLYDPRIGNSTSP